MHLYVYDDNDIEGSNHSSTRQAMREEAAGGIALYENVRWCIIEDILTILMWY